MYSADGATKVGKVSKQWTGFVREAFTDADNFGINFPNDLDVKMKAVLLGACFLIVSSWMNLCCFFLFELVCVCVFAHRRISCSSNIRATKTTTTDRECGTKVLLKKKRDRVPYFPQLPFVSMFFFSCHDWPFNVSASLP